MSDFANNPPPEVKKQGIKRAVSNIKPEEGLMVDPQVILDFYPDLVSDFYREKQHRETAETTAE